MTSARQPAPPDPELDAPADPESVARTICYRLLTARARSRAELATALSRRNVPVDVANQVLDRFAAIGLIDDEAYAEQVATGQQRERALSGRAIAMGLRQRGVDDEVIARAIASMDPAEGRAAAVTLVTRKLRAVRHLDRPTQVRRLTAVLARRGHSSEACRSIVAEVLAGQPEADGQSDALDSADEVL